MSACCSKKCCRRSCRGRVTCCLCLVCYSKFFRRSVTGDTRSTISTGSGDGSEGAGSAAGAGGDGTVSTGSKPRSLRFTWSMKTTSSMEPAEMMKEIRKVSFLELSFHSNFLHSLHNADCHCGCWLLCVWYTIMFHTAPVPGVICFLSQQWNIYQEKIFSSI